LLLATGILVAGGTTAYVQSRFRVNRDDLLGDSYECNNDKELTKEEVMKGTSAPKNKQKKGGLKSLQVLAAILLSEMGQLGAKNLLALVSIVVSLFVMDNYNLCLSSIFQCTIALCIHVFKGSMTDFVRHHS